MCKTVIVAGKEIETVSQFRKHFGFKPEIAFGYNRLNNVCLCCAAIEKTFNDRGIEFEFDGMSYRVKNVPENQK